MTSVFEMNFNSQIFILMNMITTLSNYFAPFRLLLLNFSVTFVHLVLNSLKVCFWKWYFLYWPSACQRTI